MTNVLQNAFARITEVPQDKVCEALSELARTINSLDARGCIDAWTWLQLVAAGNSTPLVAVVREQLLDHICVVARDASSYEGYYGNSQHVHRLELILDSMQQRQAS